MALAPENAQRIGTVGHPWSSCDQGNSRNRRRNMEQLNTSKSGRTPAGRPAGTRVIGAFKILDGVLLLIVAVGALKLVNGNVAAQAQRLVTAFHVDPNNHYLQKLL